MQGFSAAKVCTVQSSAAGVRMDHQKQGYARIISSRYVQKSPPAEICNYQHRGVHGVLAAGVAKIISSSCVQGYQGSTAIISSKGV